VSPDHLSREETAVDLSAPPATAVRAVLALGANLGEREATLQSAVDELAAFEGLHVEAVSPVVETDPVGGPDQPDYLNVVLLVRTTLAPLELLAAAHQVEQLHGRVRQIRWGARTLDIDVIVYGDVTADAGELQLPHPRASGRAFVLSPWLALDPQARLVTPDGDTLVADLLAGAQDRDGVRARPDITLRPPV
jgi:dihydroneopterin aldolase/2-amino-4-hydroxy-6-hydroxymethyldihydropteridine diphosphokinase